MISRMRSVIMLLGLAALVLGFVVTQAGAQSFIYDHNPIPSGGVGFNPNVNYDLPNFSDSPNIRKFVDKLPGLGVAGCTLGNVGFTNAMCTGVGTPAICCTGSGTGVCQVNNALCTAASAPAACCTGAGAGTCSPYADSTCGTNNLGQYIPVGQPDTASYPGSAYYELGIGNFKVQMHSDLPKTALRGYYQTNATDANILNVKQYLGLAIVARVYNPNTAAGAPTCRQSLRCRRQRLARALQVAEHASHYYCRYDVCHGAGDLGKSLPSCRHHSYGRRDGAAKGLGHVRYGDDTGKYAVRHVH